MSRALTAAEPNACRCPFLDSAHEGGRHASGGRHGRRRPADHMGGRTHSGGNGRGVRPGLGLDCRPLACGDAGRHRPRHARCVDSAERGGGGDYAR